MSSSRLETRKAQISTATKTLRDSSNIQEKCKALACIQSNAIKPEILENLSEQQSKEICKVVVNAFTNTNEVLHAEASCTLAAILRCYKDRNINLFNELLKISFEHRLKILQLFEGLQDETVKAITCDPLIVEFLRDSLKSVTPDKMEWLVPNSCTDNVKALQNMEYKTLSSTEQLEEQIIICIFNLLHRLYKSCTSGSYSDCAKFDTLFLDKVAMLAYMGHKRQRGPAISLLQLPNIGSHIRSSSPAIWQAYRSALQSTYCQRMIVLVAACEPDWSVLWATSIQLLGTDLHRGAGLINNLLSVEEKAFKSVDTVVRKQAFMSWKLIIDNFALDEQELATVRRVKLLCIPLNAKNSKTEAMTLTKLEVWWHLIYKLYKHIEKFTTPVLTQFLNFCFGPLGDTPLLSSKFNVVASPGKRFSKTKLVSIDALLQLLSGDLGDLKIVDSSLKPRLSAPVRSEVFRECFKPFIHCVGEALLSLSQISNKELDSRNQIISVLWKNLLIHIKDGNDEAAKVLMYKEIMLLVVELSEHSEQKPVIRDSMLDVILPSLDQFPSNYVFQSETIVNLMSIVTKPSILHKINRKHHDLIKRLLWRGVKPTQVKATYVPNTLEVMSKLVQQLVSIKSDIENIQPCRKGSSVLWTILCEMAIRIMVDGQDVNEGDAATHNFTTIQILIKFPFTHQFAPDFWQVKKSALTWKDLYRQFDVLVNLVPTVKTNEFVTFAIAAIQNGIQIDKRCSGFAVACLDEILTTMSYKNVLEENGFLPIVKLINDLCILNLLSMKRGDSEAALRELSSVLITLYGHAPTKVASCLEAVRPAVEHMLSPCKDESLVKEITSTWETIMSIFKGLKTVLLPNVIVSFQEAFRLALHHDEPEIVSQTLACLESEEYIQGPTKELVEEFRKQSDLQKVKGKKESPNSGVHKYGDKQTQVTKFAGSFLNRHMNSPKAVSPAQKPKDDRKSPYFPDPESQEYVVIKNNFRFDANRLTEHQKESLLRRREDIPALYNDLSQSCSQDTQNIQEWFDKKKNDLEKVTNKCMSNLTMNAAAAVTANSQNVDVGDADKENKLESSVAESAIGSESSPPAKEKVKVKQGHEENLLNEKVESEKKGNIEDILSNSTKEEITCDGTISVAKKLNFDSRTEFPDNSKVQQKLPSLPSTSHGSEVGTEPSRKYSKGKKESDNVRDSHDLEAKNLQDGKRGIKRKAQMIGSDSDSEGNLIPARRRRKIVPLRFCEAPSDSDSIKSTESEETVKPLSRKTKAEISRLQINMVFDNKQFSTLPSRRRSKIAHDDEAEQVTDDRDSSDVSKSNKQKNPKPLIPEIVKARVPKLAEKDSKIHVAPKLPKKRGRKAKVVTEEMSYINTDAEVTPIRVVSPSTEEGTNSAPNAAKTKRSKTQEIVDFKDSKEPPAASPEPVLNTVEEFPHISTTQSCSNSEEIVESSQASSTGSTILDKKYNNKQCFIRINKMQSIKPGQTMELDVGNEKTKVIKGPKPDSPYKVCSTKILNVEDVLTESTNEEDNAKVERLEVEAEKDEKMLCSNKHANIPGNKHTSPPALPVSEVMDEGVLVITETQSSPPGTRPIPTDPTFSSPAGLSTSLLNSISPKNSIKRYAKLKSVTPHGRAAHMLGLVTKQAIAETKSGVSVDENMSPSKKHRTKDGEDEFVIGRRERLLILKDPERLGSPSGSRQEKIFNNMRIPLDSEAQPLHSGLFGNLKNDGEKLSPGNNGERDRSTTEATSLTAQTDKNDEDNTSPVQDRESLPMLEWSSANPPSLTASPSASILKRQRQLQIDNDPESPTLSSKRKRVSFADPPVSKEMGYEIAVVAPVHRMSKLTAASRIFSQRKDPNRLKQPKPKTFQTLPGKPDKEVEMEIDKSANVIDSQANSTATDNDLCQISDDFDSPVIISSTHNDSSKVTIDNFTTEIELASEQCHMSSNAAELNEIVVMREINTLSKSKDEETETQQDIFESVNTAAVPEDGYKSPKTDGIKSPKLGVKTSPDESRFRCVNINFLTNTSATEIATTGTESSVEILEDTVDIQNVTGLNFTTNSEEMFYSKPVRTSTQSTEIAQVAECDTVTITDSVFSGLPFSQNTQMSNDTMEPDQPELLDSTRSIFPSLTDSIAPIDSVIGYLADPIWKPHLSNYLHSKGIETVGNLAQLTEREVNWIPVKRSPKVPFVRNVLQHFEKSIVSLPSIGSTNNSTQESVTPNVSMTSPPPTSTPIAQSSTLSISKDDTATARSSLFNESLKRTQVATKSTETQVTIEELLEEIDASVVLKNAIRRSSAENILLNYKLKMKNMAEEDLQRETIRLLGIEAKNNADAHFKSACRSLGLAKVIGRLPDIFSSDKQFFSKVLTTYRQKLKVSDCMLGLDLEEVKSAFCQRCTSSDLAEILSRKLKEEEERGITTPMTELSSLQAMLKRMPKDLIISHTVANEELISPLVVLDIALQNNSTTDISFALEGQPNSVRNGVFGNLCTVEALSTYIKETNLPDTTVTEMLKVVSKKLSAPKLLDAFNVIMKEKFVEHEQQ